MSDLRTKPLKVFVGEPLQQFLATNPIQRDDMPLLNHLPNSEAERVTRNKKLSEFHQNRDVPISASVTLNRLAERMLWLREAEFPYMTEDAWITVLNALNGRSEFEREELFRLADLCASHSFCGNHVHDSDKQKDMGEIMALTPAKQLLVIQFSEFYWGNGSAHEGIETIAEMLGVFFNRYPGHCLIEDGYNLHEHWLTPVAVKSEFPGHQAMKLPHKSGLTYVLNWHPADTESLYYSVVETSPRITVDKNRIAAEIPILASDVFLQ